MNSSMYTALVSMNAVQQKLDIISRNVANVNTLGYKKREASFEDVLTSVVQQPQKAELPGRATPPGYVLGNGSRVNVISLHTRQGPLTRTDNPFDLALAGEGFFEIELPEDTILNAQGEPTTRVAYTRDGSFKLVANPENPGLSYLTTTDGRFVRDVNDQRIQLPSKARIAIDEEGNLSSLGSDGLGETNFARLKIVKVNRPQMLENIGDNLYVLPKSLDLNTLPLLVEPVQFDTPVENTVVVEQGFLEASNVILSEEMTDLVSNQRAFQLLARSLSQSDTMMGLVNNLRG